MTKSAISLSSSASKIFKLAFFNSTCSSTVTSTCPANKLKDTLVPSPTTESIDRLPPINSIIRSVIVKPKPVPALPVPSACQNGNRILFKSSLLIPGPVSMIETVN